MIDGVLTAAAVGLVAILAFLARRIARAHRDRWQHADLAARGAFRALPGSLVTPRPHPLHTVAGGLYR